jgi:exopolyphosphatase/guanosine-5'-triphosphate,3'-diphosphate pyrophosphatase
MDPAPIAVIDVGTNTFHLLIATPRPGERFEEVLRERRFIKLAQDGIHHIGPAPYQRALDTMRDFRQMIDAHGVKSMQAFGTAALRTASNGAELCQDILQQTDIAVKIISGEEEAAYILRAVRLALPFGDEPRLVMDIGGGSVEFLIANRTEVFWMQSFPIGVAVLYRNFHRNEPISHAETAALNAHLEAELAPLREALDRFPVADLIGVAGTFDVLENLLDCLPLSSTSSRLSLTRFPELLQTIVSAPIGERLRMAGIPRYRADMIVVAMLLIRFVLSLYPFGNLLVSRFDLKEGILAEMR